MTSKKKIIGLSAFILFLILLPIGVKYAAVHYLSKAGAENVSIDDVDLNLFTGTVKIEQLKIRSDKYKPLTISSALVNISMLRLLTGKVLVERAIINGLDVVVENKPDAMVVGFPVLLKKKEQIPVKKEETEEEKTIPFGIKNLLISNSEIKYIDEKATSSLSINAVKLLDFYFWEKETPAVIKADVLVNKAKLEADVVMKPFSETRTVDSHIQLEQLKLASFSPYLADYVTDYQTIVTADLKISAKILPDNTIEFEQSGDLKLDDIKGTPVGLPVPVKIVNAEFSYDGSADIKITPGKTFPVFHFDGAVANNAFNVIIDNDKIEVNHDGLSWTGTAKNTTGGIADTNATGSIILDNFFINGETQKKHLFSLDKLNLNGINVTGLGKIDLNSVVFSGIGVAKPETTTEGEDDVSILEPLTTEMIVINKIELADMNRLNVDTVEIENVTVPIRRNGNGKLPIGEMVKKFTENLNSILAKTKPVESGNSVADEKEIKKKTIPEKPPVQESNKRFIVDIGSVDLKGENTIHVKDSHVKPAFKKTIRVEKFALTDISSVNVEDKAKLEMKINTEKHGFIEIKGDAELFNPKVNLNLKGTVSGVQLAEISPYTSLAVGYNIQTGVFNSKINCKIVADKLDVKNDMFVENIILMPNANGTTEKYAKMFLMPVDQTLSILKDDKNNISLSIPVTGDINNPDFHYQDVMKIAMQKAVKSASISVLKNLIQPYGVVITATQYALAGKEYLEKIRLDPIYFKPGSPEIEKSGLDYLDKIAKLLKEKKELRLSACGLSIRSDVQGGDPEKYPASYVELANQRQSNIIQYLEEKGISHKRLFPCNGNVDVDADALPRVEMSL